MPTFADLCLSATCHDPLGRFTEGIDRAAPVIAKTFTHVAINATAETSPHTLDALATLGADVQVITHAAGSIGIGAARRDALALALTSTAERVYYSDLDHILRWASADEVGLTSAMGRQDVDLLIIGRSAAAMHRSPQRLQRTESIVNHVFALTHGTAEEWDLMMAMRLMSRPIAETIVGKCTVDSIANDVSWPGIALGLGARVDFLASDNIQFLARDDFGADRDERDSDPQEWLGRLETAVAHVSVIVEQQRAAKSTG